MSRLRGKPFVIRGVEILLSSILLSTVKIILIWEAA